MQKLRGATGRDLLSREEPAIPHGQLRAVLSLQGEREGRCRNSEVLLAGICFLERNLQFPVVSCVQSSASCVLGLAEPGDARASLCC